jgi:hypothetical protein
MTPCAKRAPGVDVRPGVVVRDEGPVGSLRPATERQYRG